MKRPFLMWMEGYAVGHVGLDAEHRRLVASINEIYFAELGKRGADQISAMLDVFRFAAEEHLEHENSAMREIGERARHSKANQLAFLRAMSDAVIDEHIAEHALALRQLDLIISAFRLDADCSEQKLSYALRDWFGEHAIKYDAHLKAVFQAT